MISSIEFLYMFLLVWRYLQSLFEKINFNFLIISHIYSMYLDRIHPSLLPSNSSKTLPISSPLQLHVFLLYIFFYLFQITFYSIFDNSIEYLLPYPNFSQILSHLLTHPASSSLSSPSSPSSTRTTTKSMEFSSFWYATPGCEVRAGVWSVH